MRRWMLSCLILLIPTLSAALGPQVSPACTLTWKTPTQNENGSALTNLVSYQLFHATTPGGYPDTPQTTALASVTSMPCTLLGITSVGQHYVKMLSVNSAGKVSTIPAELAFEVVVPASPCPPSSLLVGDGPLSVTP